MTLVSSIKSWLGAGRAEGGRITGPLAPVSYPTSGWIPMSWPLNYWQCGYDVIPQGGAAIVEACVWAYIRAIAQLPGYHRRDLATGGTEDVMTSALSRILRNPNWYMTPTDFITHLIRSLLYTGNSYWIAERNDRQEVSALHWTGPRAVTVYEVQVENQIYNEVFYSLNDGGNPLLNLEDFRARTLIPARDVLHVKLETPRHPLIGESWLQCLALELMNRGQMQLSSTSFLQNAGRPAGVIMTDKKYSKDQIEEIRQRWIAQSSGENAGGTPILQDGLKWAPTTVSNADAQVIDAAKLNDRMVCAVFGVPPMLIGLSDAGTAVKTAEAEMASWLVAGLGYLLDKIEEQFDKFFGLAGEQAGEYTEFDTKALLRSQFRERIEGLARGVQAGIFAPNEARLAEGYAAAEAGDEPRVQQQMVPLSFAAEPPPPPAPPAPPADEPAADDLSEDGKEVAGKIFEALMKRKANELVAA